MQETNLDVDDGQFETSYADFSITRSFQQLTHLISKDHEKAAKDFLPYVQLDDERLAKALEVDKVKGKKILEIGPGQNMERAHYFGINNEVVGIDLDVIPAGWQIGPYLNMWRVNGFGRFAKTLGRNLLINPSQSRAWMRVTGANKIHKPKIYYDDFCSASIADRVPNFGTYDAVTSWSVFEHLPDPRTSVKNMVEALKPGGAFYISLHLYTSNNGHHDMRGFTGQIDELPLWGHLREQHKDSIFPSAYLNEIRLEEWRDIFNELAPGHTEYLDKYEHPEKYGPMLTPELLEELKDYTLDELLTVNLVYAWRKPL